MRKIGIFAVALALFVSSGCAATAPTPRSTMAVSGDSRTGDDSWAERFERKQAWKRPSVRVVKTLPPLRLEPAIAPEPWKPEHCWLLNARPCLICAPAHPNPRVSALGLDRSC